MASGSGETDFPAKIPRTAADFEKVHSLPTAAEYEKANRPFSAPTEKLPTMSENWSYAMRRYSRFQGYSFAAALGAGLLVWGGVKLGEAKERRDEAAATLAPAAAPKHA